VTDNHTPQQRSANMRAVRSKNTAPEKVVRSLLHRLGFRFRLHQKDLAGTPDIVFRGSKRLLFVHGCFWHGHACRRGRPPASNIEFWHQKISANKMRDARALKLLRGQGWKVMTVWDCQTRNSLLLEKRLSRFLNESNR